MFSCFWFGFCFLTAAFGSNRNPLSVGFSFGENKECRASQQDFKPIKNVPVAVGVVVKTSESYDRKILKVWFWQHLVKQLRVSEFKRENGLAAFHIILFELSASFTWQRRDVNGSTWCVVSWERHISTAARHCRLRSCQATRVKLHSKEFNNRLPLKAGVHFGADWNLGFWGINRVWRTHSLACESVYWNKWASTLWLMTAMVVDTFHVVTEPSSAVPCVCVCSCVSLLLQELLSRQV